MTDWTNKAVDELRAEILTPENGVTFAEAVNELARKAQANDALLAAAQEAVYQGLTERDKGVVELQPGEPLRARLILLRNALAAAPAPSNNEAKLRIACRELVEAFHADRHSDHHILAVRDALEASPAPSSSVGKAAVRAALLPIAEELGLMHVADYACEPASSEEIVRYLRMTAAPSPVCSHVIDGRICCLKRGHDGSHETIEGMKWEHCAAPAPSSSGAPAPADPWTPVQCDYDRNIHANPDANAWADFFVQVHPGLADKHDLMRAWFANAMMAMHDSPRCKPAPADSQREAAIEAFIMACTNIDWGQHLLNQGGCFHVEDGRLCGRARTWAGHQGGNHMHLFVPLYVAVTKIAQLRSAPPAPVAPVTEGEVEAAIAVWPMMPICVFCSKVLSGAAGKDAAFATAAKHAVECAENPLMRERDEANRRVAKAESDRAYLDEKLESIEYALADDIKGEHGRVDGDSVLRVIARRVEEARGAGLRELRARLVDFCRIRDRGYDVRSDFSPLWVLDEIDRLLAAPPASKLAEEPAQEVDYTKAAADFLRKHNAGLISSSPPELVKAILMVFTDSEWNASRIEWLTSRIEALENNKEAGQ